MKVLVNVYEENKYTAESDNCVEVEYSNVRGWEVVTGEALADRGFATDESNVDENNEYLVITFDDGETATFRNSHVDLFILKY